jgi:hypothetical protein
LQWSMQRLLLCLEGSKRHPVRPTSSWEVWTKNIGSEYITDENEIVISKKDKMKKGMKGEDEVKSCVQRVVGNLIDKDSNEKPPNTTLKRFLFLCWEKRSFLIIFNFFFIWSTTNKINK